MPRNVEIKARIDSLDALAAKVAKLASQPPLEIAQDDTFFRCDLGRLKLRTFSDGTGELIFYLRANQQGPRESFYVRSPTSNPDSLRMALSLAYGAIGRVIKRRSLFLIGRTRIHLDDVEKLGQFLELEVMLDDDESVDAGMDEARKLMKDLEIEPSRLVERAYIDLIGAQEGRLRG